MQTNLAPEFKGTRKGETAEAILRKCVHRGLCTTTCPTCQLLGDELDDPRERIDLIALDRGATPWRLSLALQGASLVEWGGAQCGLNTTLAAAQVRDAAAAAGGHATLFMGPERSAGVFAPPKSLLDRIHRELKRAFDPDGVFNPARLYPGLCP